MQTIENRVGENISSDQMTRDFVRQRFLEDIEMNGSYDNTYAGNKEMDC